MSKAVTIKGSEFTTELDYDPAVKGRAYELFLTTDASTVDIAVELGIPQSVVHGWVNKGGWLARKKEIEKELFERAETAYRRFIAQHRIPTAERHLEISSKIEKAVGAVIDQRQKEGTPPDAVTLKRLAETLNASATVSSRAAGISERPSADMGVPTRTGTKVPLVAIGIQVTPTPGAVTVQVAETPAQQDSTAQE